MIFLALICSIVFVGSTAFAQYPAAAPPEMGPAVSCYYEPPAWSTFEGSWLIGHSVYSAIGQTLGQISDLVIDQANDRVALVILSDVPNLGTKMVAIPYSALVRTGEDTFQLSFGNQELEVPPAGMDLYAYNLTKLSSDSDLYGIPSVIDSDWVAKIYDHYGQAPYWTKEREKPLAAMDLYRSSKLMGAEVRPSGGEGSARVDDLAIDSCDGRIALLALSNIAGKGDTSVAVPFNTLSRRGEDAFSLNIAGDKLATAPDFKESEMTNREYVENIYKFFGMQPYWTE